MSASTVVRPALLLSLALLAMPVSAAHAAPRAASPVAAHQDAWGEDDPDPAVEEDWGDDATASDDPADALGDVVDDVTDVTDGDDEDWGDGSGWEDEEEDTWEPELPVIQYVTGKTVKGKVAMLRKDGRAAIPRNAPKQVRLLISAANQIVGKPYKWGGGHAKLKDRGYDCSGTVSYALIRSGLLSSPLVSGGFAKWGRSGAGKWATIYANKGHVYMEVAGLRLDTSPMGDAGGKGPRWRPAIGKRKGFHVRHIAGL